MHGPGFRSLLWLGAAALAACTGAGLVRYVRVAGGPGHEPGLNSPGSPQDSPQVPSLEASQREYLWQVEHHGNLLSRYGFRALADVLSRGDPQALAALLSADFTGQVLRQPREVRVANDFADITRQQDAGQGWQALNREQFVARLLDFRRPFTRPPKVHLALMALRPQRIDDLDGPWQGTCQLRLWGEIGPNRPGEVVLSLQYRLPRPTEETLRREGWLRSCAISQSQTARAPHFLMREVAAERGIDSRQFHDNWRQPAEEPLPNTGGVYLCDYDRDGILDLLVVDINRIALYKGLPDGKFQDVTTQVGLPEKVFPAPPFVTSRAAFVDLDGDGWEDLILGDHVYRNDRGKKFVDFTYRTNLRLPPDALGVAVADFDRDGRMDLYVIRMSKPNAGSWLSGKSGEVNDNQLWRNKGNWQFEDVTAASGTGGGQRSTFSAVWLDADNDGWPDLYIINEFGNGLLYVNNGDGTFRPQPLVEGPGDFGSMGVTCGDIDNDGNIDLYVANMYSKAGSRIINNVLPGTYPEEVLARMRHFVAGSQLYRNRGGLRFEPVGQQCQVAAIGWSYGAALVDLDNDGWLDLYATCGFISQSRTEPDG